MDRARTRFRFPLLIILVLLVALWLRADRLDRYPPGLSDDEAMNTIDAYGLLHNGKMPLYEDTDLPEHLHRLILAAGIAVLGPSVWAFRLIQAFTGVITVAAAYWAVQQCTDDWPEQARHIGGLAGASYLAVAMPHIVLSRSLYRGLPVPLFTLLFIGFLMRGLRTNRRRNYAYSGLGLGLALHSYTAAYGIPASLGVVTLSLLIFRWRTWREWLPGLIVLGAVFALVIAPTVYVLLTDRDRVLARTEDVGSGSSLEPEKRIDLIVEQFFSNGDINSQYNADHAPLLPPVYAQIFLFGGFVLLLRIRHPSSLM
ncbi:MAG TPA: glycosyltransferase family 39 protein, partial [Aggregatilineaceae bacterium]|nr:glycosyltransferase family 39 protein [Aggregatilineaceae bacterium]